MIRTAWRGPASRANGSFPKGARRLSEKPPAGHPPPHRRGGIAWERGRPARILIPYHLGARASRPHTVPLAAVELQCDAAGSHPVGGNPIGQAEGEPWRRCRLIQVGEMAEAVPGLVRAGRPRSREASSHDIVTPRAPNCRSILVPLVVEAGPSVFRSICVPSCPFVVHLH